MLDVKRPDLDNAKVLVVEDDHTTAALLTLALKKVGLETIVCPDCSMARTTLAEHLPDAIFLDINLPDGSGYELCREFTADASRLVPVVMMTAQDDDDAVAEAYRCGASDFLPKPIDWRTVGRRAQYLVRSSLTTRALDDNLRQLTALYQALPDTIIQVDQEERVLLFQPGSADLGITHGHKPSYISEFPMPLYQTMLANMCSTQAIVGSSQVNIQVAEQPQQLEVRTQRVSANECLFVIRDVTEREEAVAKIHHMAMHVHDTGLPNRAALIQHLIEQLDRRSDLTLMLVRLSGINKISQNSGEALALNVLREFISRCKGLLRKKGKILGDYFLAQPGEQEFALVFSDDAKDTYIQLLTDTFLDGLQVPFTVGDSAFLLGADIGYAKVPDDAQSAQQLFHVARVALNQSTRSSESNLCKYDQQIHQREMRLQHLEVGLRNAIRGRELHMVYQPKYCLRSETYTCCEALARWQTKSGEAISPGEFIPLAEDMGLIIPLGNLLIDLVIEQMACWQQHSIMPDYVAVNISPIQITRSNTLIQDIRSMLDNAKMDPRCLQIELTEGVFLDDKGLANRRIQELKDMGVSVALDDFGTGYSSLQYLHASKFDVLKVDRAFVQAIGNNDKTEKLIRTIMVMARSLGMKVVAEGVETFAQQLFLADLQCDLIQGFLHSKPLLSNEFMQFIQTQNLKVQ